MMTDKGMNREDAKNAKEEERRKKENLFTRQLVIDRLLVKSWQSSVKLGFMNL